MSFLQHTKQPTDIVWLQTAFLGDIVLTTGAFDLARKLFPQARQHLVTTKIGADALKGDSRLFSVIVFEKGGSNFLRSFAKVKEQIFAKIGSRAESVILQPHRSFRSSLLARFIGLPTVTYYETNLSWLASYRVCRVAVFHEAVRIALLLEPLGATREAILGVRPRLKAIPLADSFHLKDRENRLVGIAPGSIWGTKKWIIEGYCELARMLLGNYHDIGIILLGSEKEKSDADKIEDFLVAKSRSATPRLWNLAGRTSLSDLRGIFPKLSLLISNDSSPIHYASAFNVPTVGIFGSTIPEMGFAPLSNENRVLGSAVDCRPCSLHGPMECPLKHFRCMMDLKAEVVFEACKELLSKGS